jgi:hypothetical protein
MSKFDEKLKAEIERLLSERLTLKDVAAIIRANTDYGFGEVIVDPLTSFTNAVWGRSYDRYADYNEMAGPYAENALNQ